MIKGSYAKFTNTYANMYTQNINLPLDLLNWELKHFISYTVEQHLRDLFIFWKQAH